MRLIFLLFLLGAAAFGSGYFYLTTIATCVTPIYYRIGAFDERFSLSEEEAKVALAEAEAVWEAKTSRDLFIYDDKAKFTVNFIFDDRQAVALDQHDIEARLNTVEEQNQKINAEFKALERVFATAREKYEKKVSTYNSSLIELNKKIEAYNTSSSPNEIDEQSLQQARVTLENEAKVLDAEAKNLNRLSSELNAIAQRGNVMVEVYNQSVQSYNTRFGEGREFTQGDYQGNQINIYTFLDRAELVRVLVHELGHALGVGHVENDTSMMYHMMSNQPVVASLSHEDTVAFFATCGADTDLKNRLITKITSYLKF